MSTQAAYDGLRDRAVLHRIDLEYYAAGEVRAILRFIRLVERDLLAKVAAMQIDPDLTRGQRVRLQGLEKLLREIRVIYAEGYTKLERRALLGLEGLAELEAEFQTANLAAAMDDLASRAGTGAAVAASSADILAPTVTQLRAIVNTRPMDGKQLKQVFADLSTAHRERIERAIRNGYVEGEGVPQIAERVQTASRINARGAEAIARTAITHISTEVAQASYERNADIVAEVEAVSVLDGRTTPFCRSIDGKRFPLDSGPRSPHHMRCRGTMVPILEGFPPPRRETYGGWLKRQSAETQDRVLGVARAELFRGGKIPIDGFTTIDGSSRTLADLRRAFPAAFRGQ